MRCPNCGEKVEEDVLFCPHCGQNISVRSKRKLRFILMDVQDDRRFRHLASAAVLTVVIVAVLAVLLALDIGNDDGGDTGGPSSSAIILSDTEYIEVYGCLKDGDMTASMNSNGYLVIRLSDDIRDSYGSFSWVLRNEFLNENQTVTNDTGTLTWPNPVIGVHTVTVTCSDPLTGETAVYTGTLEYCGNVHTQHTFVFDGSSYTVYVDVTNQEYRIYSSTNIAYTEDRNTGSAASGAGFITTDGAVAVLVERLIAAYTNSDPSLSVSDERFADFILSFVQSCFRTGSDAYYNSRPTYWAYPAETLYMGSGDSGDLAVLAASLLRACGYDAGIAVIHDEAFVAVAMSDVTVRDITGFHRVSVDLDGRTYQLGQLTEGRVPLGYIGTEYDCDDGTFTYYGTDVTGESGIAVP